MFPQTQNTNCLNHYSNNNNHYSSINKQHKIVLSIEQHHREQAQVNEINLNARQCIRIRTNNKDDIYLHFFRINWVNDCMENELQNLYFFLKEKPQKQLHCLKWWRHKDYCWRLYKKLLLKDCWSFEEIPALKSPFFMPVLDDSKRLCSKKIKIKENSK